LPARAVEDEIQIRACLHTKGRNTSGRRGKRRRK
jgi:hypothetical protein